MSTYLVAILVSDFKCKSGVAQTVLSPKVHVCTKPSAYNQLDYGRTAAIKLLEYFERLFKIEYPLPKLGKAKNSLKLFLFKFLLFFLKIMSLCLVLNTEVWW